MSQEEAAEQDFMRYRADCAARLKKLREEAGYSIPEFAAALQEQGLKFHDRSIYHWESAKGFPKIGHLPIIAKALGLSGPRMLLPKE